MTGKKMGEGHIYALIHSV
ncbi:MAG: hypothetical protein ACLVI9_13340 [Anaerostipes hadrus]